MLVLLVQVRVLCLVESDGNRDNGKPFVALDLVGQTKCNHMKDRGNGKIGEDLDLGRQVCRCTGSLHPILVMLMSWVW